MGDGDFVTAMLDKNDEAFEKAYKLKADGVDLDFIAQRVADLLDMAPEDVWQPGRYRRLAAARSLLCFWAVRKLNISMASMARRWGYQMWQSVNQCSEEARLPKNNGFKLI